MVERLPRRRILNGTSKMYAENAQAAVKQTDLINMSRRGLAPRSVTFGIGFGTNVVIDSDSDSDPDPDSAR